MENFPNLMREKVTQIRKAQRIPIKRNPKRTTARYFKIKWQNCKTKKES